METNMTIHTSARKHTSKKISTAKSESDDLDSE